jgi:hypothetical protein
MLTMLLAASLLAPPEKTPTFTEADVQAAIACADGPDAGACAPPEKKAAMLHCMTGLPGAATSDDFTDCVGEITRACVFSWKAVGNPMDRRVVLVCSADTRAAIHAGIDDWYGRVASRIPAEGLAQYRELETGVPARVTAELETIAADEVAARDGAAVGVWTGFARFLWNQERTRFPQ